LAVGCCALLVEEAGHGEGGTAAGGEGEGAAVRVLERRRLIRLGLMSRFRFSII